MFKLQIVMHPKMFLASILCMNVFLNLPQAFSQAYTTQRKVAEDGETNEETLLQESATKEAYYMGRLLEQQAELKSSRSQASCTQDENERLSTILQELREVRLSLLINSINPLLV